MNLNTCRECYLAPILNSNMRIGLLSDTHGFLDERIFTYFKDCDEVWHAGDIGELQLIRKLETFKPVRAVYGNIDDKEMQNLYPENLFFTCEGLNVWITHIAGAPPRYNPRVKKILSQNIPDMLVCGHSHILRIKRDAAHNNMLYLNPGAAGNQGFHSVKTLMRFTISDKHIDNMEVIELGRRGAI